jgi:DNA-binding IclR family transcriptional regulator
VVELPAYTERTITDRARLHQELAGVREQGYAVATDELELGLTALAAPVRSAHGDVVASVSVSGPSYRLPEPRVSDLVALVVEAAEAVSRRVGWAGR